MFARTPFQLLLTHAFSILIGIFVRKLLYWFFASKFSRFLVKNTNIDYYVIINRTNETDYDKLRTVVFQMEPWVCDESKNWGVKTWGDWSIPRGFMKVFGHKDNLNNIVLEKIYRLVKFWYSLLIFK